LSRDRPETAIPSNQTSLSIRAADSYSILLNASLSNRPSE
jgi:hypothetical protein